MNKKLLTVLQDKCKDFGLSEKAIEDLATSVGEGLTDETPDTEIEKTANSLALYAKLMQAEVTRKAQKGKPTTQPAAAETPKAGTGEEEPGWFKAYKAEQDKQLQALKDENAAMKAERSKTERSATIAAEAKKLGIPEYLMKRVTIADDADIAKELADFKQELVTNSLMPKDAVSELGQKEDAMKADAKAWAESLPNK